MTAYMPLPPSKCHENQLAAAPVHTSAIDGTCRTSCACCVFRHGASAAKAGVPRTGRRGQANSSILASAVENGQSEDLDGTVQVPTTQTQQSSCAHRNCTFVVHPILCENLRRNPEE